MDDVEITLNIGVDETDIEFIQHIEKELDLVMTRNGFTRSMSCKMGDKTRFRYRQFGVAVKRP